MTDAERPSSASEPLGTPTATRPSRGSIAARIALLIGILLVVFVGILPRVVDYDAVWAALSSLSPTQLAVLVVATVIASGPHLSAHNRTTSLAAGYQPGQR